MRIGVLILPEARWPITAERFHAADRLGFHHAWTYDHLTWRSFRDETWFGALPILAAAAATTERIRLGTLVASPNFRHPVPFAKELMTLDDISGGRITAGLGAGTNDFDARALGGDGWSPRERADRLQEFVSLLDRLLRSPATDYAGRFYSADGARAVPGCVQQPRIPFAIAAEGPRGMRLAAEIAELWVTVDSRGAGPDQVERIEAACRTAGRDPATLGRIALLGFASRPLASIEAFRDVAGRYAEMGFTDLVVHWPRDDDPFLGGRAVLEAVATELDAFA